MNEVNILNIGGIDHEVDDQRARDVIAHSENGLDPQSNLPISSRHYDEGDYVIGQDRLYYEVTAEINIGDVMAVGTNLRETIVSEELVRLKNQSALAVIATIAYNETGALATRTYEPGDFLYWDYGLSAGLYEVAASIGLNDPLAVNVNIKPAQTLTTMIQGINNEISDMVNVLGAKNLLKNNASSQIVNGVTFTVNSDGSVTANGTATATTYLRFNITFKKGTYKISGTPAGGDYTSSYALVLSNTSDVIATDAQNGPASVTDTFTITNESEQYQSSIIVRSGVTVNNIVFHPMIRPASIKDDTYVPYAKTNLELTDGLKWKAFTPGGIAINRTANYPPKFNELYIVARQTGTGVLVPIFIPAILTKNDLQFRGGWSATANNSMTFIINTNANNLTFAFNRSGTDITTGVTVYIYYR